MVKFHLEGANGKQMIGIGLSEENVVRLKEGKPITFSLEQFGYEMTDVLIMFGETEDAIVTELAELAEDRREDAQP